MKESVTHPTYDLTDLQKKVEVGHWQPTRRAAQDAMERGFDSEDMRECVCRLTTDDFHKTAPSETRPGTMQDVYKTEYCGRALYVKLTKGAAGKTVVISFHDDASEHS